MVKVIETLKPTIQTMRKGWLAYLGVYGTAYEQILPRLAAANSNTTDIFTKLVDKGETVEANAQETLTNVRARATESYATNISKVRDVLPSATSAEGARVEELEAEIEALTKKVATLTKQSKKTTTARKTTKKTTKKAA